MKHLKGIHNLSEVGPVVASVGMFDGVHCAHQALLSVLQKRAASLGGTYALITFWPHPQHVLRGVCEPRLLLTEEEKIAKLKELGLPYLITLPFDSTFAGYDKDFFLEHILIKGIGVRYLVIGENHRFGKNGAGTYADLHARAQQGEFSVEILPTYRFLGKVVCSTLVREVLQQGELTNANNYLGYPYSLSGVVCTGQQLGRTIGFPTANLQITSPEKLLPIAGVYAVGVKVANLAYNGMLYIGKKYIAKRVVQTVEVNLFNCTENLYGQQLQIHLHVYLRGEKRLLTKEALTKQLSLDKTQAMKALQAIT